MYGRFDESGVIVEKLPIFVKGMKNLIKIPKNLESEKFLKVVDGEVVVNEEFKRLDLLLREQKRYESYIARHIFQSYPQTKQNSDLADKLYYENLLKSQGVQNLEADIVARVQNFYDGKSLEEVLADVDESHKEAYEQLVKVGIRVAWVQQCKAELKAAIAEDREPNFPKYPL